MTPQYPDFDTYTRSLDYLTTVHLSREERIAAARIAGGHDPKRRWPTETSPYLFESLRDAFNGVR